MPALPTLLEALRQPGQSSGTALQASGGHVGESDDKDEEFLAALHEAPVRYLARSRIQEG